ncbi:erythroblast NAD(P)(+)--arginine ADP-ribosyltransferase-like protein [Turdus rufiventris]|nr:erythroblast NAD(P)(+)--arginine ADP-ribosyltransferase-like protein [Turdus rufiventris]
MVVKLLYKFKANAGELVQFGQFMSSTLCKNGTKGLGSTTVFKVQTCYGVDIKAFSEDPSKEKVVIPSFEKFNVIKVIEDGEKVEIHLDFIRTYSKYNVECLKVGVSPGPPAALEDSCWPPQPWQWSLGSSELQRHQGHQGHCGHHDHQDQLDSQRNKIIKATKATTATMVTLASMASVKSLWPPLAL